MRHPDFHIQKKRIAPAHGALLHRHRVILIESSLTRPQVCHTLAHEIAHLDLGHRQCMSGLPDLRTEKAADKLAALRLVGIHDLCAAIRWTTSRVEIAEELGVTDDVLKIRLAHLHPSESIAIRRAAEHH